MVLPLLKQFVHKLFLQTTGGAYHVQVLLGTDMDLESNMENNWVVVKVYRAGNVENRFTDGRRHTMCGVAALLGGRI